MDTVLSYIYEYGKRKVEARLDISALDALARDSVHGLRVYELMSIHRLADLYPFIRVTLVVCENITLTSSKFVGKYNPANIEKSLSPGDTLSFRRWHAAFSLYDESPFSDAWQSYVHEGLECWRWLLDHLTWVQEQQKQLLSIESPLVQYELNIIQNNDHPWQLVSDPMGWEVSPDTPTNFYDVDRNGLDVLAGVLNTDPEVQSICVRGAGRFQLIEMLCCVKLARQACGKDLVINVLAGGECIAEGGASAQWSDDLVVWYSEGVGRGEMFIQDGDACLGGTRPQQMVGHSNYRYLLLLGEFDIDFSESAYDWERGADFALGSRMSKTEKSVL